VSELGVATPGHGQQGGLAASAGRSRVRIAHEKEGARLASEILEATGWSAAVRDAVVAIVDGHDTRPISPEDELVFTGAARIARRELAQTRRVLRTAALADPVAAP
jgi:hypothetical protein